MTIRRSSRAVDDVFAIWSYIHQHDEVAADRLIDRIETKLLSLEASPHIGGARPAWGPDIRSVPLGNYLLLYRPLPDGIELLRVLHGARDLSRVAFD